MFTIATIEQFLGEDYRLFIMNYLIRSTDRRLVRREGILRAGGWGLFGGYGPGTYLTDWTGASDAFLLASSVRRREVILRKERQ